MKPLSAETIQRIEFIRQNIETMTLKEIAAHFGCTKQYIHQLTLLGNLTWDRKKFVEGREPSQTAARHAEARERSAQKYANKERALKLVEGGMSVYRAAHETGISPQTLYRHCAHHGIHAPKRQRSTLTKSDKDAAIKLLRKGKTIVAVSHETGIGYPAVWRISRQLAQSAIGQRRNDE